MRFVFSKREVARRAARKASGEWLGGAGHLPQGGRIDYWAYVINAALEAIPEPHEEVTEMPPLADD